MIFRSSDFIGIRQVIASDFFLFYFLSFAYYTFSYKIFDIFYFYSIISCIYMYYHNMKQLTLTVLLGCSIAVGICFADMSRFENVIEVQTFIENAIDLKNCDITTPLPYTTIYTTLEQRCSAPSIQEGKQLFDILQYVWTNDIRPWKIKSEMQKRFSLLKNTIIGIRSTNEQLFCKQKYLLYSLLELSQKAALGENFEIRAPKSESQAPKEVETQEHGSASNVPQTNYLTLLNHNETISDQVDYVLSQRAEEIIQQEIGILQRLEFLNERGLGILDNKIELHYVNKCGTTRGSYHMTQKVNGTDRALKQIKLNINLCSDRTYLSLFTNYVRQIFIHELAHYLYYFEDGFAEGFGNICRKGGTSICDSVDFVSTYAQKGKEEDYAESFTYRYLKKYSDQNMIVEQEHGSAEVLSLRNEIKRMYFDRAYNK